MHFKYQHFQVPEVYGGNEALRFMFRANHIYLLMASLVNLAFAVHFKEPTRSIAGWFGRIGSALVLVSPILLGVAFFVEVPAATPNRTLTYYGVILLAAGVLAHLPGYRSKSGPSLMSGGSGLAASRPGAQESRSRRHPYARERTDSDT